MGKVFLNDGIVDAASAKVSAGDSSFLYGMGLFETMRAVAGSVFALDAHFQRLFASAEALSINIAWDKGYITEAIGKVLEANNLTDARMRLTVSNGTMNAEGQDQPTLLITATELTGYPAEYYDKGVAVILSDFRQGADQMAGHKTTSYFGRLIALDIAHKKGAAEALWFTAENILAEGCISNVFIVKDGVVFTPQLKTPVLGGIARKTVIEIAKAEGVRLEEKNLTIKDLLGADEVFLTNVIMMALPVVAVEAHTVSDGKVGAVTKKLIECFKKKVSTS